MLLFSYSSLAARCHYYFFATTTKNTSNANANNETKELADACKVACKDSEEKSIDRKEIVDAIINTEVIIHNKDDDNDKSCRDNLILNDNTTCTKRKHDDTTLCIENKKNKKSTNDEEDAVPECSSSGCFCVKDTDDEESFCNKCSLTRKDACVIKQSCLIIVRS